MVTILELSHIMEHLLERNWVEKWNRVEGLIQWLSYSGECYEQVLELYLSKKKDRRSVGSYCVCALFGIETRIER